jgi:hypothetical protein
MNKTFKILSQDYAAWQQAVDVAMYTELIATNRCEHVFPPDMEADEDGKITLKVKQWLLDLEGMGELLKDLEEVEQ